jgi:hypothetical protein
MRDGPGEDGSSRADGVRVVAMRDGPGEDGSSRADGRATGEEMNRRLENHQGSKGGQALAARRAPAARAAAPTRG